LTVKTRNGHHNIAVSPRFSSLLTVHSAHFTSSAPLLPTSPVAMMVEGRYR